MSEELTRPSPHFKRYVAPFSFPINLLGPDGLGGKPCRQLRVEGAGTVSVTRASDNGAEILNFDDKEKDQVMCNTITAASGPTAITVYW